MKQNRRFYLVALVLLLAGLLVVGAASALPHPTISAIEFDKYFTEMYAGYDSYYFSATVTITAGDDDKDVDYQVISSDPLVIPNPGDLADNNENGVNFYLYPIKAGTTDITVNAIDKNTNEVGATKTIKVTVLELPEFEDYTKVVIIDKPADDKIVLGDTVQLDWDKNNNKDYLKTPGKNKGVATWSSSDTKIARVDNLGYVYSESVGEVTITLSVKGAAETPYTDTYKLNVIDKEEAEVVKPVNASKIAFNNPDGYTLTVGEKISQFYAYGNSGAERFVAYEPYNAVYEDRFFMSSDEKVVSSGTYLEAVGPGTATVTATWVNQDGSSVSTTCVITVVEKKTEENLLVTDADVVLLNNDIILYTDTPISTYDVYYVNPAINKNDYKVYWTSSNTKAAVINGDYIQGLKASSESVTMTLTIFNKDGSAVSKKLTIKEVKAPFVKVTGVTLYKEKVTLEEGESEFINRGNIFQITPTDASLPENYYWSTSDPDIAKVTTSYYGDIKVTGVKPGKAKLTLNYRDNEKNVYFSDASIEVEVTEKEIIPVTGINFLKTELTAKKGDENINLFDYLKNDWFEPANHTDPKYYKWTSSDLTVAKFDEGGYLFAVGAGKAILTLTVVNEDDSIVSGSVNITVTDPEAITKLQFASSPLTVKVGKEINLFTYPSYAYPYLVMVPKDASLIYWSTSNADVAYVTKDGVLVPVAAGTATITATAGENTASLDVNVVNTVNATAVKLSTDKFTIKKDDEKPFNIEKYVKFVPADAEAEITLSSSNPDIVSVNGYYLNAIEPGTATITVTVTNADDTFVTATATVTVKPLEITSMSFPKTEYKLTINKNKKDYVNLAAKVIVKPDKLKSYAYDEEEVIWESSDESVAKVDDSGYVTAVAPGTATITVTSIKNAKATASTNVVVGKIDVKRIKLNKDTLNLTSGLYISKAFSVLVEPANAYVKEVYYKVDNTELITDLQVSESSSYSYVDSELAYSKSRSFAIRIAEDKTGTAKVTVYVDDGTAVKTTVCTVNITAPKTTIAFDESKATIALYDTKEENKLNGYQLSVYNKKTGNTINPLDLKWTTSKKAVATVNRYGYVVPVKAGKAVITATTKDGNKTAIKATITVKQYKITGITGTAKRTLRVGDVKNVYSWVTIKPVGKVYNDTLKIASSNKKVIEVDDQGNLSAVAAGKSTITVTAKDGSKKSFKIVVNVIEAVK